MEVISNSEIISKIESDIKEWKKFYFDDTDSLFSTFFNEADAGEGNSDYPDQWSRILGINYGNLNTQTYNSLTLANKIWMHMGVYQAEGETEKRITVIFEVENSDGTKTFLSNPENDTLIYNITPVHLSSTSTSRHGISKELRNQLANNWLINFLPLKYLFYRLEVNKNTTIPEGYEGDIHDVQSLLKGNMCWIKAHYYPITGRTLDALKETLIDVNDPTSINIRLRFGVNPSDVMPQFNEMFTLVLEVDTNTVEQGHEDYDLSKLSFFDFVRACPPNCE